MSTYAAASHDINKCGDVYLHYKWKFAVYSFKTNFKADTKDTHPLRKTYLR